MGWLNLRRELLPGGLLSGRQSSGRQLTPCCSVMAALRRCQDALRLLLTENIMILVLLRLQGFSACSTGAANASAAKARQSPCCALATRCWTTLCLCRPLGLARSPQIK